MNNNYNIAIEKVLGQLELTVADVKNINAEQQGDMYYVTFSTYWQRYEAYVDSSMELVGLNFEPHLDKPSAHLEYLMERLNKLSA